MDSIVGWTPLYASHDQWSAGSPETSLLDEWLPYTPQAQVSVRRVVLLKQKIPTFMVLREGCAWQQNSDDGGKMMLLICKPSVQCFWSQF